MLRKSAFLFAVAAAVLLPAAPAAAQEPATKPAKESAANSSPLVSTEWLEKNLDAKNLRIVEVSVEPGVFERGHIPNAQNVAWHTDLVETVSRDIAGPDKFTALARRLGVDRDTTVVLYGDNNNWFAAWGAWVFAQYGLTDTVKLLDGGRKKWEAEKRPLDTRTAEVPASTFTAQAPSGKLRARFADVLAVAKKERDEQILDIRSPTSSAARSSPPPAFRNWRSAPVTSPARSTSLGQGGEPGRHPQIQGRTEGALRGGGHRRLESRSSPPAASASAPAIPGSC